MRSFKKLLSYTWILYLVSCVLIIGIWTYLFDLYHSPKKYEKISVFFAGEVLDYSFESDYVKKINNDHLTSISIASSDPISSGFESKYTVVGLSNADVIFVPESIANNTACSDNFIELSDSYGQTFFTQGSKNYGIMVNSTIKGSLSNYLAFTSEDYVLLIADRALDYENKIDFVYDFIKELVGYGI